MHRIFTDRLGKLFADRSRCGLSRIGGAHQIAICRDRVLALENLHDHRPRNHEVDQFTKERPLAVDGVELLRPERG